MRSRIRWFIQRSCRSSRRLIGFTALWAGMFGPGCRSCVSNPSTISNEAGASVEIQAPAVIWKDPIQVASGQAFAGPWRMNDSEFDYVDDPSVALAENGQVGVVWADNARKDILFQALSPTGEKLREPVNVSRTPQIFSWLPRLVMTSHGQVFVLWQEIVFSGGSHGGEIFFSRSTDGGVTFTPPMNLSNSKGGDGKGRLTKEHWDNGSLDLARGAGGDLFATWTEYDGALWFSRSKDAGQSFSEPLRVGGTGALPARGPTLAVAADGVLYLAWTVGEDASANIHFSVSRDGGQTFGSPRVAFESTGRADAPKIVVDEQGLVHLVYAESFTRPRSSSQIRYTRLSSGADSFAKPRWVSGDESREEAASFPSLDLGKDGALYLVWLRHPAPGEPARGLGFTLSRDAGRTFTSPEQLPGTLDPTLGQNGSRQGKLMRLLAANDGSLAVVTSGFQQGKQSQVRLILGHAARP